MGKGCLVNRCYYLFLIVSFLFFCSNSLYGQTAGDYRTNVTGTWNWSTVANWQYYNGTAWITATAYPGQNATVGLVSVQTGTNVTLDVTPANALGSLSIVGTGTLSFSTTTARALTVNGAVSVAGTVNTTGGGLLHTFTINGDLSGAGTITLGAATVNLGGSFTATGTFTCGTSNFNYTGNIAQTVRSSTYYNLTIAGSGIKTFSAANCTINGNLVVNSTLAFESTAARTVAVTGNLSGAGTVDMSSGSRTHALNLSGASNSIGNLVTTSTAASVVNYSAAGDQTIFASPNYRSITFGGSGKKTLGGSVTVNNILTLSGTAKLVLAGSNLTIASTSAVAGTPGANSYIVADGAGQLLKTFATGTTGKYTLPIGDGAGNYTPVALTFTANSAPRTIGVRVTPAKHPNDATSSNYINRYWNFTDDQAGNGTYIYTADFTYISSDAVGSGFSINRWDGLIWTQYTTTGTSPTATITGVDQTTSPLGGSSFTARINGPVTYTWNKPNATASWSDPYSWVPVRLSPQPSDILVFDNCGTVTATNFASQTIARLLLSNGADVSLQSAAAAQTLTINGAASPSLDIPTGTKLSLSSTGTNQLGIVFMGTSQNVNVAGTFSISNNTPLTNSFNATNAIVVVTGKLVNMGGITSTAANLQFAAGSVYEHARDGGAIPAATWDSTSNCNITGITATNLTTGINQNFGNVTINSPGLTAARTVSLAGSTTIQGDFTVYGGTSYGLTFQLGGNNFTVNGTTTLKSGATLNDNNAIGINLLKGMLVMENGSYWNIGVAQNFELQGGISYEGSGFASGIGTYSFTTNNQSISGSKSLNITNNIVITGVALTNKLTAGLTVGGIFTGTGKLINGDAANAAFIYLNASGGAAASDPFPAGFTGTVDFSSNPNTVEYNANIAQTVDAFNFYNLNISGARTTSNVTLPNNGVIGISNVLNLTATFTSGVYIRTNTTIDYNGTVDQVVAYSTAGNFAYTNLRVSGGGTKALSVNTTVSGNLVMNGAVLELGQYNLSLTSNSNACIVAGVAYDSDNMISTGYEPTGAGYLERKPVTASVVAYQMLYPVGSGGSYAPLTVNATGSTVPAFLRVKAVPKSLNPSYIKRYWDVQSNVALTNVGATFQYDASELNNALPSVSYSKTAGVSWEDPATIGTVSYGVNSFSVSGNTPFTGSATPFTGWWTMGYKTYYSYQSGDWNTSTTWTTDPSGTMQIGNTIPGYNDRVVILTGRTVTLPADIATQNLDVTIDAGGFLDMGTYKYTNPLLTLKGQGTLKLASTNFPGVLAANELILANGGTVEYNNAVNFIIPSVPSTYNNLTINTGVGVIATQLSNLTLYGNLVVTQGVFRINDNTSTVRKELAVTGNLTVESDGEISVGTGNVNTAPNGTAPFLDYYDRYTHRVVVNGDFVNRGKVRFTNQLYPTFKTRPTNGMATVYFQGSANSALTCEGQTDFFNIILDKGTDQTYKLTVTPSAYSNFRLFGPNGNSGDTGNPLPNPNIYKALWVRNGTLVLDGFTVIPSLTESASGGTPNGDYFIPANGAIVLNNPNVILMGTADSYQEVNAAYGLTGGSDAQYEVDTDGGYEAISILGSLTVNSGYLSTRESTGIVTWSSSSGQLVINGGFVDVKQLRSESGGTGKASFIQSGGQFVLRGRFRRVPAAFAVPTDLAATSVATINTSRVGSTTDGGMGTFNMSNTGDVFVMSGGLMQFYDVTGSRVIEIGSALGNVNVTGGTVELIPTAGTVIGDAGTWPIRSTAPFFNLNIKRPSSSTVVTMDTGYPPLRVLNDFSIIANSAFNANNIHVVVGGKFTISSGSSYVPGTNWTILNGSGDQSFDINTTATLNLNKFKVDKPSGTTLTFTGTQSQVSVADSLDIRNCNVVDGGKIISFAGNITTASYLYNSGIISGSGKILFNDNVPQVIDGNGSGIFQNIELLNTSAAAAPVSLVNSIVVNGSVIFSNDKLFDLSTYNLKLGPLATVANASATRYFKTAGNLGDGGLTKVYSSSTGSFTFPVGSISTKRATPAYTPATFQISGTPVAYGSITVNPVGYEHPATTSNGRSLTYFWHVKSANFTLGSATATHTYTYSDGDVVTGTGIYENEYVPARYNTATTSWSKGVAGGINTVTNLISGSLITNVGFIDGDYTAGDPTPTDPFGTPQKYYSRQSGLWSNTNTWSTVSHTGTAAATYPTVNDIVIIGNGHKVYLRDTIANVASAYTGGCASLQVEKGGKLDLFTYTTGVYGMVLNHPNGNGLIRITTPKAPNNSTPQFFTFPNGDFSDFNVNKGTTEYYDIDGTAGALYILPANVTSYGNLILTARGGDNLVLPNNAFTTIHGDVTCTSSNNSNQSWICMSWNTNYGTYNYSNAYNPTIEKTVRIKGNLNILSGTFEFMDDKAPQHLIVDGDVLVAALNGNINCLASSAGTPGGSPMANTMDIGGNLINNNTVTLRNGGYYCDLTFKGSNDASLTSTAGTPTTILNKLTIDKGISQATSMKIDVGGTLNTLTDNWLTLKNGTLKYMRTNPSTDFTITTTSSFNIPTTAGLFVDYANSGNRNILIANSNSDLNDLYLDGKLTINNGNVYVGAISGNNVNNNDIEYSGGGFSEIEINGGKLFVNGQIRRNTTSTVGVLKYTQKGGDVVVNGQNSNAARAKLELVNAGSSFNMSGGTLTVARGNGGTTFGDLYIRPASGSVTGGDIIFSMGTVWGTAPTTAQTYGLESNIPLNNLTVVGAGAGSNKGIANLMISPLVLQGSLTLQNTNSTLDAKSKDVTIGGNFTNNGSYVTGVNTTLFNGGTQNVTGTAQTDFSNLTVSSFTSLTVGKDFNILRDLLITQGTLKLSAYQAVLMGNLVNNGAFTDNNITNNTDPTKSTGVILNGTVKQQVSGNGSFGRLELNNNFGAKLQSDITMRNDIVLTKGILDINQYSLLLQQTSKIGGAPFDLTKMITTDGAPSSEGIRKVFNPGSEANFIFPVGVSGKYTPATFNITTSSTLGSISVSPVNTSHPAVLDASRVLKYYWKIHSTGLTGFSSTYTLQYVAGDVNGSESDYVAASLLQPGDSWSKAMPGSATDNVDENLHIIKFSTNASSNITGDYTAGEDTALPDDVPTYRTIKDGDWSDNTIWSPVGGTFPCPSGGPNGFNVIVDHEVTANSNYCFAYQTVINGKLKMVAPYFGHNLGNVSGSGVLYLESGNLPAGNFSNFLDCSYSGTLEFGGNGNYSIIANQFSSIPKLWFSGSGYRILPNKDLTICTQLKIDGPTVDNTVNKRTLYILGTMERYNTGEFLPGTGSTATVVLAGANPQVIGGTTGNFNSIRYWFNNLEINNDKGVTVNNGGDIYVSGNLILTNGVVNTGAGRRLLLYNTSPTSAIVTGGSSFVNGPLVKRILPGGEFSFPIGKGTLKSDPVKIEQTSGASAANWTVEMFTPNTTAYAVNSPLVTANTECYWNVTSSTALSSLVRIGWVPTSNITAQMTTGGVNDMRLALFNTTTSSWGEVASNASGSLYTGDVVSQSQQISSITGVSYTTASVTSTKPRAMLDPGGPVCGSVGMPVKFTSYNPINFNYTLDYKVNGVQQPTLTVTSVPFSIPTPVMGTYALTGFKYNGGTVPGIVGNNVETAYTSPTVADAGIDNSFCGVSNVTLGANNPSPYSGEWKIISGIGGLVDDPTLYNSQFHGNPGTNYTLRWTISNGTCKSSDDLLISFQLNASPPKNFTSAPNPVCQGAVGKVYVVPSDPATTYIWTYDGADVSGYATATSNSVSLNFGSAATSGYLKVSAKNTCGSVSTPRSVAITVNPSPSTSILPVSTTVCAGTPVNLAATNTGGTPAYTSAWTGSGAGYLNNIAVSNPVFTSSTAGTSNLTYTVTDTKGCSAAAFSTINVMAGPSVTWDATAESKGCASGITYLKVGESGYIYSWSLSDASGTFAKSGSTQDNTINWLGNSAIFGVAGTQAVKTANVIVTNSDGCSTTLSKNITVYRIPTTGPPYHIGNNTAK